MSIPPTPAEVELLGLSRLFDGFRAVDNVSLRIPEKTIYALLGANGAGKTTTINMLITLLPPSKGTARVAGYDIVTQAVQVRQHIGYVPQRLSADGGLTGYENLDLFAKLYGIPAEGRREQIETALRMMGLSEVSNKVASQYSGGMIRRLEIAQSLLHHPAVLFLDEPTVGLDPVGRRAVWEFLRQLRAQFGTTIVMSTHDMEEADTLSDTIAIMHQGKIIVEGTPAKLKAMVGPSASMDDVFVHFTGPSARVSKKQEETSYLPSPPCPSAKVNRLTDYVRQTVAIAEVELRKLRRDPTELFTRAVQPALWLTVFGQVFGRLKGIPTGGMSYLAFMAPGILAQSVLFIAIFFGIVVIWERDLGLLQKQLVTPAARSALVLGKGLSAGLRGIAQAVIVYLISLVMGVPLQFTVQAIALVLVFVILSSALFSTFSLVIACIMKTRERFLGIGQVLTMPLFFASNAIYPLAMMPDWLRTLASINPLSYEVDALRALMVQGGHSEFGLMMDFGIQVAILVMLVGIAAKLYPRIVT